MFSRDLSVIKKLFFGGDSFSHTDVHLTNLKIIFMGIRSKDNMLKADYLHSPIIRIFLSIYFFTKHVLEVR